MFNDFCQDLCKLVFKAFEFDSEILQRNTKALRCESLNIFITAVRSIISLRNLNQSSARKN